ncbi:MAG: hypothetical protein HY975_00895 [Candidatus Kerfeldbacteria bacterium]|nr:hypothetical protein [Candidatus Kerfeldbacteria bacterium]
MDNNRYHFRAVLLALMAGIVIGVAGIIARPAQAAAPCNDDFGACPVGWCAPPYPSVCKELNMTISAPTVTGTTATFSITATNSPDETVQSIDYCFGSVAYCRALPVDDPAWRSLSVAQPYFDTAPPWDATITNLRARRNYEITIRALKRNSYDHVQLGAVATWPNQSIAPTDVDNGCSVPQGCTRTINWTTGYSSDSGVIYSLQAPSWSTEQAPAATPAVMYGISALSDGYALAVGQGGRIVKRGADNSAQVGTWSDAVPGLSTLLRTVDVYNSSVAWIAGFQTAGQGRVAKTTDGASSWTQISGLPAKDFFSIYTPDGNTAWAAGQDSTIVKITGTTAATVHGPALGESLNAIFSHDNNIVLAGGVSGKLYRSTNSGGAWSAGVTLAGAGSDSIQSIASLNGQTVWAGATGGKLWRSTDGGITWSNPPVLTGTGETISNIQMVGNDRFYFQSGNRIGLFDITANPQFTFDAQPSATLGASIAVFALARETKLIAMATSANVATSGIVNPLGGRAGPATTTHSIFLNNLPAGRRIHYSAESFASTAGVGAFGFFDTPIPDQNPPVVTITAPNGPYPVYTNSCTVNLAGTATDDVGVQAVRVSVNGGPNTTATGTTAWSLTIPCSSIVTGLNTFSVTAVDGFNTSSPQTASIFFDATLPQVIIQTPANNTVVNNSSLSASGTASDNTNVVGMDIQVNGGPRQPITAPYPNTNIGWTMSATLTPGNNTVTVYARDQAGNETSASINVTYNVPTFNIVVDPPTARTVFTGDSAVFPVHVDAVNNFTGTVSFTASGEPANSSALFTTQADTLTSTTTRINTSLIIGTNASTDTTNNPHTVTITASDPVSGITKTATVAVTVNPAPAFTLTSSPSSQTIVAGQAKDYQIYVNGNSTYTSGLAAMSASGLPAGVTATFLPNSVAVSTLSSNSTVLTISTSPTTPIGTNIPLTVRGNDGTISDDLTIFLTVTAAPDYSISLLPASHSFLAGSPAAVSYNGTVMPKNGFIGTVDLKAVPEDPNILINLSPSSVAVNGGSVQFTANVTVRNAIPCPKPGPCTYTITFSATDDTHAQTVNIVVSPDAAGPIITNVTANPDYQQAIITWQTDEPANSELTVYTDAAMTQTVGTVASGTYCTAGCHTFTFTGLTPVTTYYYSVISTDEAYEPNTTVVTQQPAGLGPLQFTTTAKPDTDPSSVTLDAPADGVNIVGTLQIRGQGSDTESPMSQITINVKPASGGPAVLDTAYDCPAAAGLLCDYNYSWNSTTVTNGSYIVSVQAFASAGPPSNILAHQITVNNDNTAPNILCLPGQVAPNCAPEASPAVCNNGACTVTIHWLTDDLSTSELEYCFVNEAPQGSPPRSCNPSSSTYIHPVGYDDADSNQAGGPSYNDHHITLSGLQENQLYHYRITSCNISSLCTN